MRRKRNGTSLNDLSNRFQCNGSIAVPPLSATRVLMRSRSPERRRPREGEASRYHPVGHLPQFLIELAKQGWTNLARITADVKLLKTTTLRSRFYLN